MQLVEEATEGCWIGHQARMFTSEIGSVYSPPKQDRSGTTSAKWVEIVIDVDYSQTVRGMTSAHHTRLTMLGRGGSSSERREAYVEC